MIRILLAAILLSAASGFDATSELLHTFKKVRATDEFWAEGAAIGVSQPGGVRVLLRTGKSNTARI